MKKLFILMAIFLSACAPSEENIQQAIEGTRSAWTPVPTQTPYPTYTPPPTVFITKIIIVTPTSTHTPIYTPTITNTPAPTNTLTSTPDPLKKSRSDGFFLINVDIAPGVWRSNGTSDSCYWSVTTANGGIIDNHFGQSGGTAYLPANGFQVEFNECGMWEYISGP